MKKVLTVFFLLIFSVYNFAQQVTPQPPMKQDNQAAAQAYFKKSKTQRIVGWSLFAGGGVLFVLGLVSLGSGGGDGPDEPDAGAAGLILGPLMGIASIPVLISAGKNKGKGQALMQLKPTVFRVPNSKNMVPGLQIQVPLTRK